jgi:hypothetical protein
LSCKGKSKIFDEGSVGGLIVSSEERGEKRENEGGEVSSSLACSDNILL